VRYAGGALEAQIDLANADQQAATVPGRGWWVWFRFYSPGEAFFDKTWQLPDFKLVDH
jgi:hypothetical protein